MANMIDNDKMWASLIDGNSVKYENGLYEYGDLAIRIRNALKEQGLEYNPENRSIETKFNVGDVIRIKGSNAKGDMITNIYTDEQGFKCFEFVKSNDRRICDCDWELVQSEAEKSDQDELTEFENKLGEIIIPTWEITKECEECQGEVEDIKKWAKELLDIAHRQFSKEEANNDTYTESELCLMSPYQLCKILEGHSDRIKISDNYADLANEKKTFRMYKFSRLFGSIGYDIVEFETGKNPYISYHWGLGEDPYIKEDDDEFTHIVPDEYRESVIKVLIDGILKRQIKKT